MARLAWINGQVYAANDAKVSVFDRGFLFGDGVYETGRSQDGVFLFLEEHLARLRSSAAKLQISVPWSDEELVAGLGQAAKAFGKENVYFRTIVTRGELTTVSLDEMETPRPTLVHVIQDLNLEKLAKAQKTGVGLLTSRVIRNATAAQDPNIKTSNYLNSLLALQDVKARGGDDAVMCNAEGQLTEGTTFSVFGVTATGEIITPALSVGILDSITRRHVLEIAEKLYPGKVKEGLFPLETYWECREFFLASSVREVVPAHTLDKKKFEPALGPVTEKLQQELKSVIQTYVKTHPKY